jgi:hypothetical protein
MTEAVNIRKERIERLLEELRYEVTRGVMEGEVEEYLSFNFVVPVSKVITGGIVSCEFRTRPMTRHSALFAGIDADTGLRVVK